MTAPLIDDSTPADELFPAQYGRGLVPRDFGVDPVTMFAPPDQMPLVPRSEWDARIDEQERQESSLEHLYLRAGWPHLDQGQFPLCWAHSVAHTALVSRTAANAPYVPLSAFGLAMTANGFRNSGGWCGLSAKQARDGGIPLQADFPQGSISRDHDTPTMRANAAAFKVTEDWVDLTRTVYDQNLTFDQVASCLLGNIPVALDYSWWAHSICGLRLVRVEAGSYGIKILNSWRGWGDRGMGVLRGQKAVPDGAVATRVVGPVG